MKDYLIKYYGGNEDWIELTVKIQADVLTAFSIGKGDFLVCQYEGKTVLINKDSIYTIAEL
ncbi:MAG: hypothetical protein RR936_12790 [Carnobacterium sp.]|uniref:hypothetical protein n=1 Tax=Carnobacterium sp. TaxID=48221 RepID=UPI002FC62D37